MNDAVLLRELGPRLRAERKRAGLSQDAVGIALGMKTSAGQSERQAKAASMFWGCSSFWESTPGAGSGLLDYHDRGCVAVGVGQADVHAPVPQEALSPAGNGD